MAQQVILMPAIGQFGEFESSRVHTRTKYNFVGTCSCAQIHSRKARKRELAAFDESRRALGMLNPMRDKTEGTYRGGEGTTPVTTACPEDR